MRAVRLWHHEEVLKTLFLVAAQVYGVSGGVELAPPDEPARNYGNFRIGASSETNARPELCLELAPLPWLSLEGCGTGSGFLHSDPDPELAHFRTKLRLASRRIGPGWLQVFGHAGFAELQLGVDEPGFSFGGTSSANTATSGPEAGASLRALLPASDLWEVLIEIYVSGAYLPHADELSTPRESFVPSAGFSIGTGF